MFYQLLSRIYWKSRGSIVNAASTAAIAGLPCGAAYSASKGGVLAMTRSFAIGTEKEVSVPTVFARAILILL